MLELRPKGVVQPFRFSGNRRGNVVLPDQPCHDLVRLIRESLKTLAAPVPLDDERNSFQLVFLKRVVVARAPCGLCAVEVRLELRYHVERGSLVFFAAWLIHCIIVPVSIPSSMSF